MSTSSPRPSPPFHGGEGVVARLIVASIRHFSRFGLVFIIVALFGCSSPHSAARSPEALLAARTNYPAHWWTPIPTNGAPAWEILPQAAGPGEVILSKRDELGLLSNFAATPFTFHGQRY